MGGKVSKAKRPKRRWIGLSFPSAIRSRSELADVFESSSLSGIQVKLYDFTTLTVKWYNNLEIVANSRMMLVLQLFLFCYVTITMFEQFYNQKTSMI